MPHVLRHSLLCTVLLTVSATSAAAQYRRHIEELDPLFGATFSAGVLFGYDETLTPQQPPEPEEDRRGIREVGNTPWISATARYGRAIAIYANVGVGFPGEAQLSGTDPLTGAVLEGSAETGTIYIVSGGASFVPLRDVMGLRLDVGPALVDLGNGGSYIGVRIAASANFLEIGDRGAVLLAWDGYFAGGQHDRGDIEYQIRRGLLSGVRVGFELAY